VLLNSHRTPPSNPAFVKYAVVAILRVNKDPVLLLSPPPDPLKKKTQSKWKSITRRKKFAGKRPKNVDQWQNRSPPQKQKKVCCLASRVDLYLREGIKRTMGAPSSSQTKPVPLPRGISVRSENRDQRRSGVHLCIQKTRDQGALRGTVENCAEINVRKMHSK